MAPKASPSERVTKRLTKELIESIGKRLERGVSLTSVCGIEGIPKGTMDAWLSEGKELPKARRGSNHELCVALVSEVARARGVYEDHLVDTFEKACEKDPRVALEALGRRYNDEWGRKDSEGKGGFLASKIAGRITIEFEDKDTERNSKTNKSNKS